MAPNTGIGLVENADVVDSMESAAPDVPAESNDGQKELQRMGVVNAFRSKKSIEPTMLAAEPGGEETHNDVRSEDPKA